MAGRNNETEKIQGVESRAKEAKEAEEERSSEDESQCLRLCGYRQRRLSWNLETGSQENGKQEAGVATV